jgi:hypothetical protein
MWQDRCVASQLKYIPIKIVIMNATINIIKNLLTPNKMMSESEKWENNKKSKINSLAYLAYKNRKNKGLINENEGCPIIYFGDEWAF